MPQNTNSYFYNYSPHRQPAPRNSPKQRGRLGLKLIAMLCLVGAVIAGYSVYSTKTGAHELNANSVKSNTVFTPRTDFTAMDQKINKVIRNNSGIDIGVAYVDLASGSSRQYALNIPFVAASTTKVLTAVYFLHQVEQNQAKLSDDIGGQTAEYQLRQMIEASDNNAWELLNSRLGHSGMSAYATQIGLHNYDPDQNTATPADLGVLLQKLYQRSLLNSGHRQLLLSYMAKANEADYIPAAVPTNIKVYHKAGILDDRIHDIAIIDNDKSPYVLVVFTNGHGTYDTAQRAQIIKDITTATLP